MMKTRAVTVRRQGASTASSVGGRRSRIGALVLVVAGFAAACGSPGQTPPVAPITLENTAWRVHDISGFLPVQGWEPFAIFRAGTAQGWSGCSRYEIPYKQSPGTIDVNNLSVNVFCWPFGYPGIFAETERQFATAMDGAKWVNVDSSGNLVFDGPGGKITWVPAPDVPVIP